MAKNTHEFLKLVSQFAEEQRQLIEAECAGFKTDPLARARRIEQTQGSYQFFIQTYFPHYIKSDPSLFHEWTFAHLPAVIDANRGCREAVAAPRGEAKSTLVTQLMALWCIVTQRKHFIGILMDSSDQAWQMLEVIKVELEANPRLLMDFPETCGSGRVWQVGEIVTANNVKVKTAGSGKRLRGWRHGPHRPDLIVLDDIENDENVRKKEQRDKLLDWVFKAVLNLGPPDGSMDVVIVGTVLHYDSVLNRIMNNPMWHSKRFSSILEWPNRMDLWEQWEEILLNQGEDAADQFYYERKALMDAGAVVCWPDTRPLLLLMKLRANSHHAFNCEQQNDPTDSEDAPFKTIHYWVEPKRDWVFYGAVDPSLGKNNKARDPSAILVGGFDRNSGQLDVVEAKIARRVPDKIISDVIELQKAYPGILVWGIETVQFQEFLRTELVKRSAAMGVPVPATPITPITDKDLRIESLQPHVANGLIRLHRNQSTLFQQLRHWPEADHDDGPDALHMLWMLAVSRSGGIPKVRTAPSSMQVDMRHFHA